MAFFKFRKAAGEQASPASAPESVDALRKRARSRLIGAALLVLAGVIGFPLLFDNQPRPIAVGIPIDIPDKAKANPLASGPVEQARQADAVAQRAGAAPKALASTRTPAVADPKRPSKDQQKEEVILSSSKPAAKPAAKVDSKPDTKAKPGEKPADKTAATAADKAGATSRFIVQFGSFSDSAHAHEARLKVERAGLKTYMHIADTPDGKKYRVRVGPFEKRSDAEKAADKIKKLDLSAALLEL